MKKGKLLFNVLFTTVLLVLVYGFQKRQQPLQVSLSGAWMQVEDGNENVLLFADGYVTQTIYNKAKKQFMHTRGGPVKQSNGTFNVLIEFDTENNSRIGQNISGTFEVKGDELKMKVGDNTDTWKRVDNGQAPLAGVWRITHRMENNQLTPIHQTGPRKTIKILTGNRFQWAAINPETKEFSGTGGGTYSFINGKYTENIEFFSRDSSRVGAALTFDDKLEGGAWHHSGLSSRGDKIYEVWGRIK